MCLHLFEGDGQQPKSWAEPWQLCFLCNVSLSLLPQAVGRQDSTSCPSTSCYSGPLYMPSAGESEGVGGRQGGTTSGTPFPSDPSPYYRPDCKSETKQQQRLISCGFTLCAYYVYWKDHYTGWTMCTLTLQLAGRDLSSLFKHSSSYIRMNHSSQHKLMYIETTRLWQNYISDRTQQPHACNLMCIDTGILWNNPWRCSKVYRTQSVNTVAQMWLASGRLET